MTKLVFCIIIIYMKMFAVDKNRIDKICHVGAIVATIELLVVALLLSFTVADYYIFNKFAQFNFIFIISQCIKKVGLLLLPLAIFYKLKSPSDIAKYLLPVFIIISCFTFGDFFNITAINENSTPAQLVYANINEFMPKGLNIALFFISNALYLIICGYLFYRDGFKVDKKSFVYLPFAVVSCMPLNIFENFFDINNIANDSFLRFKNFTVWHGIAITCLIGSTIASYYFLKNKNKLTQNKYLVAAAIAMLIQYHSKDSMIMGDGYNVYHTIFACIPLFICNIGVYMAALTIFIRKKVLYAISFFVHSAGAMSVFVYFGRDEMSNFGIFCSYSILYFCLTHILLFVLCVLPIALNHYKFKYSDCLIPLAYYFVVIITASLLSGIVSSASMGFSYNGHTLQEGEYILPNYAFTQINPLPIEVPMLKLTIWRYDLNALYILGLYISYVLIFFAFNGCCLVFATIRKKALNLHNKGLQPVIDVAMEIAATNETEKNQDHAFNA